MGYQGSDVSEGSENKEGEKGKETKEGKDLESVALSASIDPQWMCKQEVAQIENQRPYHPMQIFTF